MHKISNNRMKGLGNKHNFFSLDGIVTKLKAVCQLYNCAGYTH